MVSLIYPTWEFSLQNTWNVLTYLMTIAGIFVIYFPELTPPILVSSYRYGKTSDVGHKRVFTVPKRWFTHFYVNAVFVMVFVLATVVNVYFFGGNCPDFLRNILHSLSSPSSRYTAVSAESVTIAAILVLFQASRRLYECLFVSVFSNSAMSIVHYTFGIYYYTAVGLSLIIEAPGFSNTYKRNYGSDGSTWMSISHVVGIVIFICGCWIEYQSLSILASMRKNSRGEVVSQKHEVPTGGLFEMVSCPHYLGEIIMYVGIGIIFSWQNATLTAVVANVLLSQTFSAKMSHDWYRENYPDYPKKRKALIPFIM